MQDLSPLAKALAAATGPDTGLDALIAASLDQKMADYSGSVDRSGRLVATLLADWHLHVGFGGSGVFPYATLSRGEERAEAEAPTVPLAILRATIMALAII
jgi:hypothetical protein